VDNKTISAQGKKLLIFHALFTAAISLTGGFTNIFLWRLKNDFSFLAYYNLMFVLLLLVGYVFAGYLLTLIKSKTALRIAFILCILGYSSMLIFKERIVDYILLYGIIQGIGQGIY